MQTATDQLCVLCWQRINNDHDGRMCTGCHNPVHLNCLPTEAPSEAVQCSVCGVNLKGLEKTRKRKGGIRQGGLTDYSQIPWYRQSWVNNLFVGLSLVGLFPLAWWTCWNLLTGDVYFEQKGHDGRLLKWGLGRGIRDLLALFFGCSDLQAGNWHALTASLNPPHSFFFSHPESP